jgi:hypothetical protein
MLTSSLVTTILTSPIQEFPSVAFRFIADGRPRPALTTSKMHQTSRTEVSCCPLDQLFSSAVCCCPLDQLFPSAAVCCCPLDQLVPSAAVCAALSRNSRTLEEFLPTSEVQRRVPVDNEGHSYRLLTAFFSLVCCLAIC